jgi:trimethylamine--corrinoid protein Co-methyltransferase
MLSATTVVQLAFPGAKVIHGGGPTAMNMNSGAYASNSPEAMLLRGVQGHMAGFYKMPAWYGSGATTAKEPGIQSSYENTLAMMMAYLNGADVTFGTGLLDGSRILCLENMVVDNEVLGMVKRLLRGITVNEETLAVDLIREMGFGGEYLFSKHTRRHVRELWSADLGETRSYEAWRAAGSLSTVERAQAKVAKVLAVDAEPFPDDLGREFDAIIAAAGVEAARA